MHQVRNATEPCDAISCCALYAVQLEPCDAISCCALYGMHLYPCDAIFVLHLYGVQLLSRHFVLRPYGMHLYPCDVISCCTETHTQFSRYVLCAMQCNTTEYGEATQVPDIEALSERVRCCLEEPQEVSCVCCFVFAVLCLLFCCHNI
jgi:hypothetical protein